MHENILLIDKPKGITSFDVIRQLRRKLGIRKMGHGGTLDPLASGLLIVGVNEGTKKLNEYLKLSKTYETEILLGERRDTGDMEGEIIESREVSGVTCEDVEHVLDDVVGEGVLELPVPRYSAVKQGGQPLYRRARKGEQIDPPIKPMQIDAMHLYAISYTEDGRPVLHITMDVGSGAYVRSIAEEVGRRLGCPAVVKELRRTRIGKFDVKDASNLQELSEFSL